MLFLNLLVKRTFFFLHLLESCSGRERQKAVVENEGWTCWESNWRLTTDVIYTPVVRPPTTRLSGGP